MNNQYTPEQFIEAAKEVIADWKDDEPYTKYDYERLGFVHMVVERLKKSNQPEKKEGEGE